MFAPGLLSDKRILVTGGGSGLGEAMAIRFAELGAELAICGRRENMLEAAAEKIQAAGAGRPVRIERCDLRDPQAVEQMFDRLWSYKPLDILVNNAAANFIAQTEHLSARAADAVLSSTLHGNLYCTLAAGRRWLEAGHRGVILSILSTSALTGRAFIVPSAMAKSALLAMTRSLAVEWGPRGVRTVAIAPGPFPTPGAWQRLRPAGRPFSDPATHNPLGRVGQHIELANLASYAISDAGGYLNGEMITLDGGAHLRTSGAEDLLSWSNEQWEQHRAELRGG